MHTPQVSLRLCERLGGHGGELTHGVIEREVIDSRNGEHGLADGSIGESSCAGTLAAGRTDGCVGSVYDDDANHLRANDVIVDRSGDSVEFATDSPTTEATGGSRTQSYILNAERLNRSSVINVRRAGDYTGTIQRKQAAFGKRGRCSIGAGNGTGSGK